MNLLKNIEFLNPIILTMWIGSLCFDKFYKVTTVCIILLCLYNLFIKIFKGQSNFITYNKMLIITYFLFLFTNTISSILFYNEVNSTKFLFDFIKYSFFIIIPMLLINSRQILKQVCIGMATILVFLSLNAIYEYCVLNYDRVGMPFPNLFGWILLILAPFGIIGLECCNIKNRKIKFLALIILIVLFSTALILTKSRGNWLAFIIAIVIILFHGRKYFNKILLKYLFFVFLIASIIFFPIISKRVSDTIDYKNNYSVERLYIWQAALNMGKDYFWTGIGYDKDKFMELYDSKYHLEESKERHIVHPHNLFLYFFVRGGILGISGFILFIIAQYKYFFNKRIDGIEKNPFRLMGIWFICVTVISQLVDVNFHFIAMQKIYWALLGIIISSFELVRR